MARFNDIGPYAKNNVKITTSLENVKEANFGKIKTESQLLAIGFAHQGEKNNTTKLTTDIVLLIREIYTPRCPTNGQKALAARYKVNKSTIYDITSRRRWKHI